MLRFRSISAWIRYANALNIITLSRKLPLFRFFWHLKSLQSWWHPSSTTIIPCAPLASRLNRKKVNVTPVHKKRSRGFSEKLQAYLYVKQLVNPLQHGILRNRSWVTTQVHRPEPRQKHISEDFDSVDNWVLFQKIDMACWPYPRLVYRLPQCKISEGRFGRCCLAVGPCNIWNF